MLARHRLLTVAQSQNMHQYYRRCQGAVRREVLDEMKGIFTKSRIRICISCSSVVRLKALPMGCRRQWWRFAIRRKTRVRVVRWCGEIWDKGLDETEPPPASALETGG